MSFAPLRDTVLRPLANFVDALSDPARRGRAILLFVVGYALIWTLYGVISKQTQDLNADMAEMVVWTREMAWGFPKHPPFLAFVLKAWFTVFPLADWAYTLLAVANCALGIWLAFELAGEWLDGVKRAAVPFLLALIPFYNFLGLKFDQNTVLITLWALTTLAFVRSLDTRHFGWAVLAGTAGAAAMLTKYWSAFFLLALVIAGFLDKRRAAYFRSPAPYVTALVALACVAPHVVWLVQHDFPPFQWVANRRAAASVFNWLQSAFEYAAGTIGYAILALVLYALAARPSLAALLDTLFPREPDRRRAALLFWLPLIVPVVAAAVTATNLISLWNIPALNLLPVILLSSPLIAVSREAVARIAAVAVAVSLAALLASPVVAWAILKYGVENDAAYARMVMAEMDAQWHRDIDKPLKLIAGPFGLISTAAFYGADRPSTFADFSSYLSPWAPPERIARGGLVIACPLSDPDFTKSCLQHMASMTAKAAGVRRSEIEVRRHWLGLAGPAEKFAIALIPPKS